MKWNHLPNAGGLYQQSPQLLDDFLVIWEIQAKHEKKKSRQQEAERRKMQSQTRSKRRR